MGQEQVLDQIANLPQWLQSIIIVIWFVGPVTGIGALAFGWIKSITDTNQAVRLEAVEIAQIEAKSKADAATAVNDNMQRVIDGWFRSEERWQKNFDTNSERQRETHQDYVRELNRAATELTDFKSVLEIQSGTHETLVESVERVGNGVQTAISDLKNIGAETRHDVTTALGLSVSSRVTNDDNLRALKDSFSGLRTEVLNIISRREEAQNQTLQGIEAKFMSIEASISALINPRPALLGTPDNMQSLPGIAWDEDAEVTANIPSKQLADNDGNPTPNPHDD